MSKQNKHGNADQGSAAEINKKLDEMNEAEMQEVTRETNDEPGMFDGGQAEALEAFIKDMPETDEVKAKPRAKMGRSTIYLLKAFKEYINKLATYKVCTAEEITELRKIHKTATERWIGLEIE